MRTGTAVIGANFGDEGKGLITDFEARRTGAEMVARFNGGAQAGHTVVDGENRHVFGHVGAGALGEVPTYLSSRFIVNPLLLMKELTALDRLGITPRITVHPSAQVTTIYDMALNAISEIARGINRHGSCGVGINETVTRTFAGFPLRVEDFRDAQAMIRLDPIRNHWVHERLGELVGNADYFTADMAQAETQALATDVQVLHDSLKAGLELMAHGQPLLGSTAHVIFEGAQGLMLDEFLGVFPHVTRSMTGLPYALEAAKELGVQHVTPLYVTRTYMTRHGAGHLRYADKWDGPKINDPTNIENRFQGSMRFAPLDVNETRRYIRKDLDRGLAIAQFLGIKLGTPTLAVTWADLERVDVVGVNGVLREMDVDELKQQLQFATGVRVTHVSRGPQAGDVAYSGVSVE